MMAPEKQQKDATRQRGGIVQHRCDYCEVTFARLEHLKRHQTMHNKLKAFACSFCGKKFARSDVLSRHYQSCKPAQNAEKMPIRISQRVNRACSSCRLSKVKCSGNGPCDRCCSIGQRDQCQFKLRKPRQTKSVSSDDATLSQSIIHSPEQYLSQCDHLPHQEDANNAFRGNLSNSAVSAADEQISSSTFLQPTRESFHHSATNEFENGPGVELELGQAAVAHLAPNSLPDIGLPEDSVDIMSLSDLGPDLSFDLDPLDWGLFENSLMAYQDDGQNTTTTISGSPYQGILFSGIGMSHFERDLQEGTVYLDLPVGIDMMQISPLEAHRMQILQCMEESGLDRRRLEHWLSLENMSLFIRSYFAFFHQHTPLIHLPFWNVATASTRLIFSILLMGAMYSGHLNSHSSDDRQLCHLARSFAWKSDPDLEVKYRARLDTIQAVFLATVLEAFYFPSKGDHPGVDTTRLFYEARKAEVFKRIHSGPDPQKLSWDQWSAQECRIRTAFIFYLFDAIQAIYFDRRPALHLHELQLPLPCDESIFLATTEDEWRQLFRRARDLTRLEYPVVLSLFLCHRPIEVSLHFSVMGAFTILHGILLYMWEQKNTYIQNELSDITDKTEQHVRNHLAATQAQLIDNALRQWRICWSRTVSRPLSVMSCGLYRDRALVYWFLGNAMNRSHGLSGIEIPATSVNKQKALRIPRLLRRLSVLVDSGKLADVGEEASEGTETLDSCLKSLQETEDVETGGEGIDAIVLSCMMRKRRGMESENTCSEAR
ncbi:hypothetical protein BKA56DRAFT_597584 [Ilyonectria sp. MPI-CAGE-AT-0026]|nr:hypothetical protein BKA56DRAFT_597584 [Ilyonectria sp. MPI-CAGE-AT-0026]